VRVDIPADGAGRTLERLNPRQLEATTYAGGPLLVVAGPGTGKTRVIAHRIAHSILECGLPPESLLAVTFTNRAAAELRERVEALVGKRARIRTGTFHWMCAGLLRRHAGRIGYRGDFRLLTPRDARLALRGVLEPRGNSESMQAAAAAISARKNGSSISVEAQRHGIDERRLRIVAGAYQAALRRAGAMDLDDLLANSVRLLREHADVRRGCRRTISELLVDEYQDTNPVQQELLRLLAPLEGSIVAVGDPDQAIYSWRQAGGGTVQRFLGDFPRARVVTLEETYRSTKHVLRAATALIARNGKRTEVRLRTPNPAGERPVCYAARDDRDEATWIARQVRAACGQAGITWDECAVLYRTNAQSRVIEDALIREGIPYQILSGRRFYDREEIRTAVAYLSLALDAADDRAAAFLLGLVPGVGDARVAILSQAAAESRQPLSTVLQEGQLDAHLPADVREGVRRAGARVTRVVNRRRSAPEGVAEEAIAATIEGLDDGLASVDRGDACEQLAELRTIVRELGGRTTLRETVERLSPHDSQEVTPAQVSLMSLHAAKGLEFSVVFLAGLEEGLLPHRRALESLEEIEEERRLCYVGMTRARGSLHLSYARSRSADGGDHGASPSRFLAEMGSANVAMRFPSGARAAGQPGRTRRSRRGEEAAHGHTG
jgi:DNA helicase-2/ATP-dependent DNA helicase PcrA